MNPENVLESLELKIAKLLRYGVMVAGVFLFIGWMSNIQFKENPFTLFQSYHAQSLISSLQLAWTDRHWADLISYAGLFLLISLPVLRVALTAILFAKQKEPLLAAIATFVLVVLVISFSLGINL